jgi:opacity protein-like surface antigen
MRTIFIAPLIAGVLIIPATARAQGGHDHADRGQVEGFGGVTFRNFTNSSTFGGGVAGPLTSNIHVIGEFGQMSDVMSPTLATLLDITPVDVRLRAFYGEGGIRILGGRNSPVRPYAEATAGFARLRLRYADPDSRQDVLLNTGLQFLDSTQPLLGLGAGVILQAGPAVVDLGYRYKKIHTGNAIQSALAGGDIGVNQFRIGVGFRF